MNISNIKDCFGCGVCATVCARHIIDIRLNNDGFYEPQIRMRPSVPIVDCVLRCAHIRMMDWL